MPKHFTLASCLGYISHSEIYCEYCGLQVLIIKKNKGNAKTVFVRSKVSVKTVSFKVKLVVTMYVCLCSSIPIQQNIYTQITLKKNPTVTK